MKKKEKKNLTTIVVVAMILVAVICNAIAGDWLDVVTDFIWIYIILLWHKTLSIIALQNRISKRALKHSAAISDAYFELEKLLFSVAENSGEDLIDLANRVTEIKKKMLLHSCDDEKPKEDEKPAAVDKEKIGNFDDGYKVGFSAAKHNQWKPSDEQMKALQESIGIVGELTPRGELLKELVEQLKKLREE